MALKNCNGKAFVAFVDISGFKSMLQKDPNDAHKALCRFFQTGYDLLDKYKNEWLNDQVESNYPKLQGMFISDCAILITSFYSNEVNTEDKIVHLQILLEAVRKLNKEMLKSDYMLTTSIAFGDFRYENRLEFDTIEKNLLIGNAYVDAFLDSEDKNYKLKPGQCRIVCGNNTELRDLDFSKISSDFIFSEEVNNKKHRYFYWNLQNTNQIIKFENKYKKADDKVYEAELKALKNFLKEN